MNVDLFLCGQPVLAHIKSFPPIPAAPRFKRASHTHIHERKGMSSQHHQGTVLL